LAQNDSFGAWVRERRRRLDLTQIQLSNRINCSLSMVRKIERDERRPSQELAEYLADLFAFDTSQRQAFLQMARGLFVPNKPIQASKRGGAPNLISEAQDRAETTQTAESEFIHSFDALIETAEPPPFLRSNNPIQRKSSPDRLVDREEELDRLGALLSQTKEGQSNLIFINGEAGAGKTSLLETFARQAQVEDGRLIIAQGICPVYTGVGDPYLPFRTILSLLLGDVSAHWSAGTLSEPQSRQLWQLIPQSVRYLVAHSPELIDVFAPRWFLEQQLAAFVSTNSAERQAGFELYVKLNSVRNRPHTDKDRLFESFALFLENLAATRPLLLVLDDLHWGDISSLSLLSFLGRRLAGSAVLFIGAYRPEDVAQGRRGEAHPLQNILSEWQGQRAEVFINLDKPESARRFVDALLENNPNPLPEAFRRHLAQLTGGHPLFTVEVLRYLQEQSADGLDASILSGRQPIDLETLPPRVEGIIARRINRLDDGLKQLLAVASVEGERFTAEVLAQVLDKPVSQVVRRLSGDLDRRHQLVRAQDVRQSGMQRQSIFKFRHNLFQKYVYEQLGAAERVYFHEDVGQALEQLFEAGSSMRDVTATRLARHFVESGHRVKASQYLLLAGQHAASIVAYDESIAHLEQGLALLSNETSTETVDRIRFELTFQLAQAYWYGGRAEEVFSSYEAAIGIARQLAEPELLARAVLAYEDPRWRFNLPTFQTEQNIREALAAFGETENVLRVRLLVSLSRAMQHTSDRGELLDTVQQALLIARRIEDQLTIFDALRAFIQIDRRPQKSAERLAALEEIIKLSCNIGDHERLADALGLQILEYLELGNIAEVKRIIRWHRDVVEDIKQPFQLHIAAVHKTWLAFLNGEFDRAEKQAYEAADIANRFGLADLDGILGIHMFSIRWQQGRMKEIAPLVKLLATNQDPYTTWQPGLAILYAFIGERDHCRELFDILAVDSFALIPRDSMWATSLAFLTEACVFLGDLKWAAVLYELLLPYNGRTIVAGTVMCYGAADHYLGKLAALLSDWSKANQHFEDALALNRQMEAWPWLAQTQYELASMRLSQGQQTPGNLTETMASAQAMGMDYLTKKVAEFQAACLSG
jgi:transcriptional regulator with XRE-family HTH domain/tetratricopeptide (TPR) repeat protein